jgi:methyltransferase (TIGR00027 family)
MAERKIERKGSSTSGFTCFSRACAARETGGLPRGPDSLAEIFMPPFARILLDVGFLRAWCVRRMFPPGMHEYVTARTGVFDEAFSESLSQGFSQIVLLGAGMDTRALRLLDGNAGTKVYELDIRATQDYKRKVLARRKIPLPANLVFVAVDFSRQRLSDALRDAGFAEKRRTLFLWEGVTMYLEAAAVDDVLSFIRDGAGEGSVVVFDYVRASVLRREGSLYGERGSFEAVARAGEPWIFGIEDGEAGDYLAARGLTLIRHYTPRDLERAFLTAEDGTVSGRINATHCIVKARVSRGNE